MSNMVNITINGSKSQAPEGLSIIEAADLNGVHIPNLCHLKGMKGIGACRLCMVDVEGLKAPIVACTSKIKEGMKINTNSARVLEMRRYVIDLILSMHPLDCMTCTKAGICRLQQYAYELGLKESTFTRKKFGFPVDESNPLIKRDPDYCVLCGRCVRVCRDQGTNVLEFMGRGVGSKVATANEKPLQESGCTFCGSCIDVCPVNAILEGDRWRKGREWEYASTESICLLCGNACAISVKTKDGTVARIAASEGPSKYICATGRFGFDSLISDKRVTFPMKRVDGELKETTWEDAIASVAAALKEKAQKGVVVASADIVNEAALSLKKMAAQAGASVISTASLYGKTSALLSGSGDLGTADLIVLAGLNPCQWSRTLPALDAMIRRRINAGAKLIVINNAASGLDSAASSVLSGDVFETLKSLAKAVINRGLKPEGKLADAVSKAAVTEAVDAAAALFVEAKHPIVISSAAAFEAASNLGAIKGGAVSMPLESNARGVTMMGIPADSKVYHDAVSGSTELFWAVGDVPMTERPNAGLLVVQNAFMTDLAQKADIVLPSAAYLETSGSIVDFTGSVRKVCAAVEPYGASKTHSAIFGEVSSAIGGGGVETSCAEIKGILEATPKSTGGSFEKTPGMGASEPAGALNPSLNGASRLLWLKENGPKAK